MRGGHVDAVSRTHVAGWAADSEQPDRALELCVLVDGREHGRMTANLPRRDITALGRFGTAGHGFHLVFPTPLTASAEHRLSVRYADTMAALPNGERVLTPDLKADAPPAQDRAGPGMAPQLTPILVSAPGRSGTTYLMSCLAASPQVVAAELIPYEVRLLSYYASVFDVLTAPADLERSTHPDRLEGDGFHIGFNPFSARQYAQAFRDQSVPASFHERWVPERLGLALAETVREYYARLAADQGKPAARLFAEKNNNLNEPTRAFVRRTFPGMREIAITRDPRDVLCSQMAYFSSSQDTAFKHLSHSCRQLLRMHEAAGEDLCFVRYEDLVGGTAAFETLSAFLGATVKPAQAQANEATFARHATSESPQASIGRWHRDLPHALRAQTATAWGPFLERFGYRQA